MLRVNPLQLLPACGADFDEVLRSLQFALVRVQHRLRRDILGSRVGNIGTIDLSDRLSPPDAIAELRRNTNDSSSHQRSDRNLPVGIRLDDPRESKTVGRRLA